jgi:hypothetical protein
MLIAAKFSSELRMKVDSAGKTTYVPFSGPAAAFPFEFSEDAAGKPVIVLAEPPDNYTFTQLHAAEPAVPVMPSATVPPSETPVVAGATDTTSVVTLAADGTTIRLHPGQRFLLKLGEDYDWTVIVADQDVASRVINVMTVRGAQGLYEAHKVGQTTLTATGDPACRSAQPPCSAPSRRFQASIVVASE